MAHMVKSSTQHGRSRVRSCKTVGTVRSTFSDATTTATPPALHVRRGKRNHFAVAEPFRICLVHLEQPRKQVALTAGLLEPVLDFFDSELTL